MISRRKFFIFTSGLVAAPMVAKAGLLMPLRGVVMQPEKIRIEGLMENFNRFCSTPYLDRMDFGDDIPWGPGNEVYDIYANQPDRLQQNFEYINRKVLEFREQQPHVLGPDKRRWRTVEVNGPRNKVWVRHDDHLRDQIRDAIKQTKVTGVV